MKSVRTNIGVTIRRSTVTGPTSTRRLLLEMQAGNPIRLEVGRIVNNARDHEPPHSARRLKRVPVLGEYRVAAERHTVLPQIPGAEIRGHHFQAAVAERRGVRGRRGTAPARDAVPRRHRVSLPRPLSGRTRRELQDTRLRAVVGFDQEGRVIAPRDTQPGRRPHQRRCSVGAALLTCRGVLRRIPRVGRVLRLLSERDTEIVAFRGRDHPPAPILADHRDPVAGEIERRRRARGLRRLSAAPTTTPALSAGALSRPEARPAQQGCRRDRDDERQYQESLHRRRSVTRLACTARMKFSVVHGPVVDP